MAASSLPTLLRYNRALASIAVILVGLAGRAATDKVLALRVGPEAVALAAQLQSVIDLVSSVALAGIGQGLTVLVARGADVDMRWSLLRCALWLGLGTSLAAALLASVSAGKLAALLSGGMLTPGLFVLASFSGWMAVVPGLVSAYWLGYQRQERVLLLTVAAIIVSVAAALSANSCQLIPTIVLAQSVPGILAAISLLMYARTRSPAGPPTSEFERNWRDLIGYLPVGISIGILSPVSMLIARSILSQALSWRDAGLLQALWRSSEWIASTAGGLMAFYFLTRLSGTADSPRFRRELLAASAATLIPSAILFSLLLVNQRMILATLYDTRFVIADRAAALFLLGDWVRIGSWIFLYALLAMRRTVLVVVGEIFSLPLFASLLSLCSAGLTLERVALLYLLTYLSYFAFNAVSVATGLRR